MKGLLLKDIRLMLKQKMLMFIIIGVSVFLLISGSSLSFVMGYEVFIVTFMAVSTISYDSFDNGMAFLFTMPVSRKEYVFEKYMIVFLTGLLATVVAFCMGIATTFLQTQSVQAENVIMIALMLFLAAIVIASITIPVNLKFGSEKGKFVVFAIAGVVAVFGYLMESNMDRLQPKLIGIMRVLEKMSEAAIFGIIGLVCVMIVLVSMGISIRVTETKEY